MKKKLLSLFAGALTLVGANVANANMSVDGWYLGASGSLGFPSNQNTKSTPAATGKNVSYKVGGGGAAAIGMKFMENFRVELEGSYRTNNVQKVSTTTTGKAKASGSTSYFGLMANVAYDIPAFEDVIVSLGGGLGWVSSNISNINQNGTQLLKKRTDNVLGWQLMAQVGYMFHEQFMLYVGYRLFSTTEPKYLSLIHI